MARFSTTIERLLVIVTLSLAFLFMASVFVPSESRAGNAQIADDPGISASSVDAHAGMYSMGEIKGLHQTVKIFATSEGPRYTIFDTDGVEIGTLLSIKQVIQHFNDDLPLREFQADAPLQLMHTEPIQSDW